MKNLSRNVFMSLIMAISVIASDLKAVDVTPLEPGKKAPSFSLPTLSGKRESLATWCGDVLSKPYVNTEPHIVILSFWATYCKPCQKEIPELMKFCETNKSEKIKMFLVNIDKEGASVVGPFVDEKKYTLPVLLDPYKKTAERYGVRSLPALIVIGPDGVIRYSSVGFKENESLDLKLEAIVKDIKEGRQTSVSSVESLGETVDVQQDAGDEKSISPKEKWRAVAKIETGTPPEKIAQELGVSKEEIKSWYDELKGAALELWGSQE